MKTIIAGILALAATSAHGQGYENYGAGGFRGGLVDVDHLGMTFTLGAFYEMGLAEHVTLSLGADFWQASEDEGPYEVTVRDIALGGFAKYIFASRGRGTGWSPYAGGGIALHMLRGEVEFDDGIFGRDTTWDDNESELGLDLGGGVLFHSSRDTQYNVELRFRSVDDDVDHITITAGILKPM